MHALGCRLYELLAGEPPHAELGTAALTHAILHTGPPAPSIAARRHGQPPPGRDPDALSVATRPGVADDFAQWRADCARRQAR